MADNKPALFPITAFIVSYHYARSDGSPPLAAAMVYDLFIAGDCARPRSDGLHRVGVGGERARERARALSLDSHPGR